MKNTAPHYLLITESKTIIESREDGQASSRRSGQWRFVLEQMGVEARIEVADEEPNVFGERLELLAVVRGLESLEQASRVTLLTSSRYVSRGVRQGLTQWRADQWRWERFGKLTLIKNHDLWRRVDQTLRFHSLECRLLDLGRLAQHAKVVTSDRVQRTSVEPSTAVGVDSVITRTDQPHRRSNVIRPHGDGLATTRKPIQPAEFGSLSFGNLNRPQAGADPSPERSSAVGSTGGECCSSVITRVKPPRAGRAYGYAVN